MKLLTEKRIETISHPGFIFFIKLAIAISLILVAWRFNSSIASFGFILYSILRVLIKPRHRESYGLGLLCLVASASFLLISMANLAELMVQYSYYFLVIAVTATLFKPLNRPRNDDFRR